MNRVLVPDQTRVVLGFDFINVIVQKQKSSRIHMFSSIPKSRVLGYLTSTSLYYHLPYLDFSTELYSKIIYKVDCEKN